MLLPKTHACSFHTGVILQRNHDIFSVLDRFEITLLSNLKSQTGVKTPFKKLRASGIRLNVISYLYESSQRSLSIVMRSSCGNFFLSMRECHIQPDWLLGYRIRHEILVLQLIRTGTCSDLFSLFPSKRRFCCSSFLRWNAPSSLFGLQTARVSFMM